MSPRNHNGVASRLRRLEEDGVERAISEGIRFLNSMPDRELALMLWSAGRLQESGEEPETAEARELVDRLDGLAARLEPLIQTEAQQARLLAAMKTALHPRTEARREIRRWDTEGGGVMP